MSFQEEKVEEFLAVFDLFKDQIRASEGCLHLQLWQDIHDRGTIFTYSHWKDEDSLNAYRNSDTFAEVWPKTKAFFRDKPQAWSINAVDVLD